MGTFNYKKGDDAVISIPIIKDGNNVDVSACPEITALLFPHGVDCTSDANAMGIWKIAPSGSEGTLQVNATENHKVDIYIERAMSLAFKQGVAAFVILCNFTDGDFTDGSRTEQFRYGNGNIQDGCALNTIM